MDATARDSKRKILQPVFSLTRFVLPKGSQPIKIRLLSPQSHIERTGNHCTASQWFTLLTELGHQVQTADENTDGSEVLIALHAGHSHDAIRRFRESYPLRKIIVALSGSDIYPGPDQAVLASIACADRVVALQDRAAEQIPPNQRHKVRVIIQSAMPIGRSTPADSDTFPVCVVGHFRDVKDPLRTASATRLLPKDSKIHVHHAGGILEPCYQSLIEQETQENPRYDWLGVLDGQRVADLIASSRILVLTSHFEGGARVVGEALVHRTAVLSSRIDGVIGLLGEDYPAYFPVGDSQALAELLHQAETDAVFLRNLENRSRQLAPRFHPDRERDAWQRLLEELQT